MTITSSGKMQLDTSDPHTKAVWECALRAAEEVAAWPAWKHNEVPDKDCLGPDLQGCPHGSKAKPNEVTGHCTHVFYHCEPCLTIYKRRYDAAASVR